jgi:hypothetical protein
MDAVPGAFEGDQKSRAALCDEMDMLAGLMSAAMRRPD